MRHKSDGYAIIFVLSLLALLGMIVISYAFMTRSEMVSSRNTARSTTGFYAAEAALNARAETFRAKFQGFLVPAGTSPDVNNKPCVGSNTGSGDFACQVVTVNGRNVTSYVEKLNTQTIQIGAGEQYANLNAEETQFVVYGQALNSAGNPEAITKLVFRSRLVPLFQFAIFFNKDLEFDNTAALDLVGPVHANGNIFLDSGGGAFLHIGGQVTSSQTLYRGQKSQNYCGGAVSVDGLSGSPLTVACSGARRAMTVTELGGWQGQMRQNVPAVTVPDVSSIQPVPDSLYWAQADIRVVLKQTVTGWAAELQNASGNTTVSSTVLTGFSTTVKPATGTV
jgi:Tfp pilus assembly protein PilX